MGSFYDIIPWGSTCILGAYWHYMFYGDKGMIEDNYEVGQRYFSHECSMRNSEGFLNHGLGDWGNPDNALVRENIETAFLYADAKTLSYFADVLGKPQDAEKYREIASEIRDNYNSKLLVRHPERGYWCYRAWDHPDELFMTQALEALPLYWGMVPEEKLDDVVRAFKDTLEEKQALVSGEVGLPYIIQTASRYGMNELIYRFITREEHPSYYAFVLDDETTLGEYWEKNPRSHCHDMMGHIIEWFYNSLAAIEPLAPGFKKVRIAPYLPQGMNELECSYHSVNGIIRVRAVRDGDTIKTDISVPDGIEVVN